MNACGSGVVRGQDLAWPLLVSLLLLLSHGAALAHGQYDIVVREGDAAPGTTGFFSGFSVPVINVSGQVAYSATLLENAGGVTAANDNGIWRDSLLVAREGSSAAGTTDVFSSFNDYFIDGMGRVGYQALLLGGSGGVDASNDTGIWRNTTLIAREGDPAHDIAAHVFEQPMTLYSMNAAGQTAYDGVANDDVTFSVQQGLWRDTALVTRTGDNAGGTTGTFTGFSLPLLNNVGQLAYSGELLDVPVDANSGIWRDSTLIVREGDAAGGTTGVFDSFAVRGFNDAGDVLHRSVLRSGQGGVTAANDDGVWRNTTLIAREGDPASGTTGTFAGFVGMAITNAGHVAYGAALNTGVNGIGADNNDGLWFDATLIAREGSAAPGAPAGAVFDGFFVGPYLNNGGQMFVRSNLRVGAGGVTEDDDRGLWLFGPNGDGLLVAREGDIFDGKTIDGFLIEAGTYQSSGPGDGRPSLINDFAQLSYVARFTDGSEAVVRFTPDVHWAAAASGDWDQAANWTLSIAPGTPHDVFIDTAGNFTITGPSAEVTVSNLILGGGTGVATLELNAGILNVTDAFTVEETGVLTGTGVIGSAVSNDGEVRARNVTINGGLTNNGLVRSTSGFIDRISADLDNTVDGEVRVGAGESLYLIGNTHANSGRVDVLNGELEIDGVLTNHAGGQMFVADSTVRFNDGLINDGQVNVTFGRGTFTGDIAIGAGGQFVLSSNSNTTFFDAVSNGGELRVSAGSVATFFGAVTGPGVYTGTGTKFFEALFAPGSSPGLVTDEGDVVFGTGALVEMEIGGYVPGVDFDRYEVAGQLSLGGTLVISLIDDFSPQAGDVFDLFDWGTLSGEFLAVNLAAAGLEPGLLWDLGNLYTNGSLSVIAAPVPVPGAIWLMVSALAGVLVLRARAWDAPMQPARCSA